MAVRTQITPRAIPLIAPVDYKFMQGLSENRQDRYDEASMMIASVIEEGYGQDFYNEQARNKYMSELEVESDRLYDETPDFSKNYNKVLRSVARAKKSPYVNLNKRALEQDKLKQAANLQYGADSIDLSTGLNEPLFDQKTGEWKDPQSIQANVIQASKYTDNTEAMLNDIKADAYTSALSEAKLNDVPTGMAKSQYIEELTQRKIDQIIQRPEFIAAWKKTNPTYNYTTAAGVTFGDDDQNIVDFIRGVVSDKAYRRQSTSYVGLPKPNDVNTGSGSAFDNLGGGKTPTSRVANEEIKEGTFDDIFDGTVLDGVSEYKDMSDPSLMSRSFGKFLHSFTEPIKNMSTKDKHKSYEEKLVDTKKKADKYLTGMLNNSNVGLTTTEEMFNTYKKALTNMQAYDEQYFISPETNNSKYSISTIMKTSGGRGVYQNGKQMDSINDILPSKTDGKYDAEPHIAGYNFKTARIVFRNISHQGNPVGEEYEITMTPVQQDYLKPITEGEKFKLNKEGPSFKILHHNGNVYMMHKDFANTASGELGLDVGIVQLDPKDYRSKRDIQITTGSESNRDKEYVAYLNNTSKENRPSLKQAEMSYAKESARVGEKTTGVFTLDELENLAIRN